MPAASPAGFTDTVTVDGVLPFAGATESQLPPLVVDAATVKLRGLPLLETATGCDPGGVPPIWKPKDNVRGATEMVGAAVTVKVTETVSGLFAAPADVIVIVPLYTAGARPAGFTLTVRLAGVVPPPGATESQLPPFVVDAAAVKVRAEPLLPTAIVLVPGGVPPCWNANDNDAGVAVRLGAAVTVNVTGTVTGLFDAWAEVMVIAPLYAPGVRPAGFTFAVRVTGVVPVVGATDNQLPPVVVDAAAAKLRANPLLPSATVFDAGVAPPIWKLNDSELGATVSVGADVTVRETGTLSGLFDAPAEVMVTAPLYTPGASPAVFTLTVRLAGVVPLVGATESQFPPDVVDAAAVKERLAPPLAETASVRLAG